MERAPRLRAAGAESAGAACRRASGDRRVSSSAIYEGWVSHRRLGAVQHSFRYRVFMTLLDLDELPELFDRHPLYSARRPAPVRFRRSDYLGDPDVPLAESARRLVGGAHRPPAGGAGAPAHPPALPRAQLQPGQLLLPLRSGRGESRRSDRRGHQHSLARALRLCGRAEWLGADPRAARKAPSRLPLHADGAGLRLADHRAGDALHVRIASLERGSRVFDATLAMRRRELSPR